MWRTMRNTVVRGSVRASASTDMTLFGRGSHHPLIVSPGSIALRRAKFYALTRLGRKELESETANWRRLSSAISHVVQVKEA